jgi:hypothetical protein
MHHGFAYPKVIEVERPRRDDGDEAVKRPSGVAAGQRSHGKPSVRAGLPGHSTCLVQADISSYEPR